VELLSLQNHLKMVKKIPKEVTQMEIFPWSDTS
jgi:hypothetical protein